MAFAALSDGICHEGPNFKNLQSPGRLRSRAAISPSTGENDGAALKSILRAVAEIKNDGLSMGGILPEGTRNHGEGLLPLRSGAFKIAQKAQVPIVVARLDGVDAAARNFPFRSTRVQFAIRQVLPYAALAGHTTAQISPDRQRIYALTPGRRYGIFTQNTLTSISARVIVYISIFLLIWNTG